MQPRVFEKQLAELLKVSVDGLIPLEKVELVHRISSAYLADRSLEQFSARFEPFVPGRRPDDEKDYPGLGSSEEVGLYHRGRAKGDPLKLLIRCFSENHPVHGFPEGTRVSARIEALNLQGFILGTLDGWDQRDVTDLVRPCRPGTATRSTGQQPRAMILELDTNEVFHAAPSLTGTNYLGFGRLYHQRFRISFDVRAGDAWIAGDDHIFEIHNEELYGSLYQRLIDVLLPHDTRFQAEKRGHGGQIPIRVHPWYPVLSIGMQKARLYMNAIVGDLVEQKRMLTNPGWLLRVGLYLEFLTCLGIAEAVKDQIDILTPDEREEFENSADLARIRKRIDVTAWKEVWSLREIAFAKPGGASPASSMNLMRKRNATLGFLHAHHEDLKVAIELAGPNLHNAQETWHRVFRDAERAVLQMNEDAFPELSELPEVARKFALWHEKGRFAGMQLLPGNLTELLGDQDGVLPSACRQYRASMNHIAEWALERGLMEYTGAECIPTSASLLEAHLSHQPARLAQLQRRDGYAGSIEILEQEREGISVDRDQVAAILGSLEIFRYLSVEEVAALAEGGRPIVLGPLERIIVQGRPGTSLFILLDGTLEVISRVEKVEKRVALLQPPAVIGELAFLLNEKRSATVRAVDEATVLEIGATQLRPLVQDRPSLLETLTALLEDRRRINSEPPVPGGLLKRVRRAIFG